MNPVGAARKALLASLDPASGAANQTRAEAQVSLLKRANQADADVVRQLMASATGVGSRLDVLG